MCIVRKAIEFARNGASVLRDASKNNYKRKTDEIRSFEKEMFSPNQPSFDKDRNNLSQDKDKIRTDINNAFNEVVLGNG